MADLFARVLVPIASEEDAVRTAASLERYLDADGSILAVHVVEKAGGALDKASVEQREIEAETAFDAFADRLSGDDGDSDDVDTGEVDIEDGDSDDVDSDGDSDDIDSDDDSDDVDSDDVDSDDVDSDDVDTEGVDTEILYGTDVAATIIEAAHDHDTTAIAFTPRGGSRWVHLLTGDVATSLVEESDVPVVVLPDEEAEGDA